MTKGINFDEGIFDEGERYENAVTDDFIRELEWKKAPGLHKVTAHYKPEDEKMAFSAIMRLVGLYMMDDGDPTVKNDDENPAFTFNRDGIIEFNNDVIISIMVNDLGVDFNGASAYRSPTKGK